MSQTLTNIITALAGQASIVGLAAFFWQYIQERLKKIEELDRRTYRLELRDEMRKEASTHNPAVPVRPRTPPQQPK